MAARSTAVAFSCLVSIVLVGDPVRTRLISTVVRSFVEGFLGNLAGQEFHGLFMKAGVAGCQDLSAMGARATFPVCDDAPGAFDNRNECSNVPAVKTRFDDHIDEPKCKDTKKIAVSTEPCHACRPLHAAKCLAFGR